MSTKRKTFIHSALIILVLAVAYASASSQDLEIRIKLPTPEVPKAEITITNISRVEPKRKNWLFTESYADAANLSARVKELRFFDRDLKEIPFQKFKDGEFVSSTPPQTITYSVLLPVPGNVFLTAHVSWIGQNRGLIMLYDILPIFGKEISARVEFDLPGSWNIACSESELARDAYQVKEIEDAVFLIAKRPRGKRQTVGQSDMSFSITGDWQFTDDEAFQMAFEIFGEYQRLFGKPHQRRVQVNLVPFPKDIGFERWRAETRGSTISIISSPTTFSSSAAQRLHEQLRHELFHLWIPNGLNLSGDYAWFYEGFSVYQSLKTGVWLGRITFQDYLNTLAAALSLVNASESRIPLSKASIMRRDDPAAGVYARGLLVAFITDLTLLRESKGERDLTAVFALALNRHNKGKNSEGAGPAILSLLRSFPELSPIVSNHIVNSASFDLTEYLETIGIEVFGKLPSVRLKLKGRVSKRQKALLKKLGYNRWRLFLKKSK